MLLTLIILAAICLLATILLLDFIVVIPKFGSEHFGAPDDIKDMMKKIPDRPRYVNVLGVIIMVMAFIGCLAVLIWAGADAVNKDMSFVQIFLRFLIIFDGYKLYDIICFDWIMLTKMKFPEKLYPDTKGAKGYESFGFNAKSQLAKLFIIFPLICLILAFILSKL
ncbi:hypothetical protein H8356DRAFT_1691534 [Neocallimastix lanati (nom. inval.)]|uniref:Uncharacterized protein n=1 Tax=Neocallimastix californiae TaxID=1754190 RepID=A0A1Y2AQS2_9FUNG|nr:hypothetical protein H8356DRAFT_1691534 [Neocallimastix sp. JGI-2020a]ORY24814.1 hypothetical protein LY90DRAFT_706460 [Neocallimastix californiae]|eukprot:ORY24814.1 hypothetical protein LY90DRAFT_706460 [Neocallimastix californiae]